MSRFVVPTPGMIITEDVVFMPGVYKFFKEDGIIIGSDNVTVNGNGAVIIGGKPRTDEAVSTNEAEFSYGYGQQRNNSLGYHGIGVNCTGRANVTITGLTLKNFEIGIYLEDSTDCTIRENDCSYNYHNPDHGWDEHDDLGGIILLGSHNCQILKNKATDVWSALVLRYSDGNLVESNNFSHTSNVGLRLWRACRNTFRDNDFSWGLRINPGEVHARDSSCVLIETGSNDNQFFNNDMRYGGDGLFIRSLNHWMSTGNYFEGNDTSFANNNAIEAWDEGNTYVNNIVSYSSYGFWLGNSDNTILKDNQVEYNGICFHNAPECFGNAGIAVAHGTGTNFIVEGNKICHNRGAGIAVLGLAGNPVRNWVVKDNLICDNQDDDKDHKGHGIFLKNASHMYLYNNTMENNQGEAIHYSDNTDQIVLCQGEHLQSQPEFSCSGSLVVGEEIVLAVTNAPKHCHYTWQVDHVNVGEGDKLTYCLAKSGLVEISLFEKNGESVNFISKNLLVLPKGQSITKELMIQPSADEEVVSYEGSTVCQAQKDQRSIFSFNGKISLTPASTLFVALQYEHELLEEKENPNPVIRFKSATGTRTMQPVLNLLNQLKAGRNDYRYNELILEVPLTGNDYFTVAEDTGNYQPEETTGIEVEFLNTSGMIVEIGIKEMVLTI